VASARGSEQCAPMETASEYFKRLASTHDLDSAWFAEVTGETVDGARMWLEGGTAPKRKQLRLVRAEALASFGCC
jgi:hypothetical protein